MNTVINVNQTVGEIVAMLPKASEIFKQYKIDFCCGGDRKLSSAVKEQNLDEGEVLRKLNETFLENSKAGTGGKSFTEMSLRELTQYIEDTHHVYVRKVLPELGELTVKIMKVHGQKHAVLFRVHKLFSTLRAELEQHLIMEEEVVFPLIAEYDKTSSAQSFEKAKQVIRQTEDEHEAAGNILKELRKITEDYSVPEDGCSTYYLTFKTLEELEADLFQHIHLENNILFKKMEGLM